MTAFMGFIRTRQIWVDVKVW